MILETKWHSGENPSLNTSILVNERNDKNSDRKRTYHKLLERFFKQLIIDADAAWVLDGGEGILDYYMAR